jgi:hypothetical protein
MELYHTTPALNATSIKRYGLLVTKRICRMPCVWLHSYARRHHVAKHLVPHHGCRHFMVFRVSVPRSWVRRRRSGIYTVSWDIPPERICGWYAMRERSKEI